MDTKDLVRKSVPNHDGSRSVMVEVNGDKLVRIRLAGRGGPATSITVEAARELAKVLEQVANGWPFNERPTDTD